MNDEKWDFGVKNFSDVEVKTSIEEWRDCLSDEKNKFLNYKPYPGWVNHIEI
jgi:hypothetical protein